MQKIGAIIVVTAVALVIGLFGIAILIGVGEALNNAIAAFAAVSFPFALLAGLLTLAIPEARWYVAIAMAAPVTLLCLGAANMGSVYVPGAIWTAATTGAGAYIGGRLRQSRPDGKPAPSNE